MPAFLEPLEVVEGVEPTTDRRETTTAHFINARRIRFVDGFPEKIGGWSSLSFNDDEQINGLVRSIFSYKLSGQVRYLVGTNTRLYDIFGTQLTNITPVKSATISVANALDNYHATLSNDPIETTIGSTSVVITDTAHKFRDGDTVTISGSTAVNGIPAIELNADLFVRSVTANTYTVIVSTPATSSGSGGGAAVVRSSGYITVNSVAHGLGVDDRVKITGSSDIGGVLAAEINLEFEIRNVTTNTFDVYTLGTSTSSVIGGGGASAAYQEPIDSGLADTLLGQGYGVGLYGTGLYGVSKTSSTTTQARIWSHDRFGDLTISTPGNSSGLYQWDGSTTDAPSLVANAPTEINYCFVSDNIAVVLGFDTTGAGTAKENGISWSDQGGLTTWDGSGQSGGDSIEGAGRFLTHASARQQNLLFTESQTYTFRYIGGQFIWETRLLDSSIGIIGPNARAVASGDVYWMAANNFYRWRGANVEVVPSNSSTESTILDFVFGDINFSQKEKIFTWYNQEHREVWWHYPSAGSNEPDRIARYNIDTSSWTYDDLTRTAAEYPSVLTQTPYLSDENSVIYLHENGLDDDGSGMDWEIETRFVFGGTDTIQLVSLIPDLTLSGSINLNVQVREYPFSSNTIDNNYVVTNATDKISLEINGRYWKIKLSGNELGQEFKGAQWYQEVQRSTPQG